MPASDAAPNAAAALTPSSGSWMKGPPPFMRTQACTNMELKQSRTNRRHRARAIQDWLGHVSITHTTRYKALPPEVLKQRRAPHRSLRHVPTTSPALPRQRGFPFLRARRRYWAAIPPHWRRSPWLHCVDRVSLPILPENLKPRATRGVFSCAVWFPPPSICR